MLFRNGKLKLKIMRLVEVQVWSSYSVARKFCESSEVRWSTDSKILGGEQEAANKAESTQIGPWVPTHPVFGIFSHLRGNVISYNP